MLSHKLLETATPVVVGGLGGSGTRLIARMLVELGYYIGDDLNESLDNLWFVLLFNYPDVLNISAEQFDDLLKLFLKAMLSSEAFTREEKETISGLAKDNRNQFTRDWLQKRKDSLLDTRNRTRVATGRLRWGWKVPTVHIILDRLIQSGLSFKYVHVMRNGLDMAYSRNQNQLKFWGRALLGRKPELSARDSLKYWNITHQRVMRLGQRLEHKFHLLNFDQLCQFPELEIESLTKFLDIDNAELFSRLRPLVRTPVSLGRYRNHSVHDFDLPDLEFVRKMGFPVE